MLPEYASMESFDLFFVVPFLSFCIRKRGKERDTLSFISCLRIWEISFICQELNIFSISHPLRPRLHVLPHRRRASVGVQAAGRILTNCPLEHPPVLQYQILSTKECYWALEAFLRPRNETDQNFEVQYQDDISEVFSTCTKARVRTRCVVGVCKIFIEVLLALK